VFERASGGVFERASGVFERASRVLAVAN